MSLAMNLVGKTVKEVATPSIVYQNCSILDLDEVGVMIQVERTITEEGDVETVESQIFLPWAQIMQIIVQEERP
jgi:hypothetical protein